MLFLLKKLLKILINKKVVYIYLFLIFYGLAFSLIKLANSNKNTQKECIFSANKTNSQQSQLIHPAETKLNDNKNAEEDQSTNLFYQKLYNAPLIFIGGYARSGTTLMRAILDVHPLVSCGPETKIIPEILQFIKEYKLKKARELLNSGFDDFILDSATSFFIYYLMENHIRNTKRLCAKDPDILYHINLIHKLFPKAKFIHMVRDGRAVAYSMMSQVEKENTFEIFKTYFGTWNSFNQESYSQCLSVGDQVCKVIKYEDLVLNTRDTVKSVAKFLNLTWTDKFLNHDKYVGNKIVLSKTEWSNDQIKLPIYKDSLSKWEGKIQDYDHKYVKSIGTMLNKFGYE